MRAGLGWTKPCLYLLPGAELHSGNGFPLYVDRRAWSCIVEAGFRYFHFVGPVRLFFVR